MTNGDPVGISKTRLWTGRVLSWMPALLLLVDGVMKISPPKVVIDETAKIGFPVSALPILGVVLTLSVLLYLFPRTSVLGAILLTGYLGGAVATHVYHGDGAFPILFPAVFGAFLWSGLLLQDPRLQALLPWKASPRS